MRRWSGLSIHACDGRLGGAAAGHAPREHLADPPRAGALDVARPAGAVGGTPRRPASRARSSAAGPCRRRGVWMPVRAASLSRNRQQVALRPHPVDLAQERAPRLRRRRLEHLTSPLAQVGTRRASALPLGTAGNEATAATMPTLTPRRPARAIRRPASFSSARAAARQMLRIDEHRQDPQRQPPCQEKHHDARVGYPDVHRIEHPLESPDLMDEMTRAPRIRQRQPCRRPRRGDGGGRRRQRRPRRGVRRRPLDGARRGGLPRALRAVRARLSRCSTAPPPTCCPW